LGTIRSRNGKFSDEKKPNNPHLTEQASKTLYAVLRKMRYFNLPFNCQIDLFDKVINPILLYSCEIWGDENVEIIEKVHLKFLKFILSLKSSTICCMVYGESGR
jgi:hypothetical protein